MRTNVVVALTTSLLAVSIVHPCRSAEFEEQNRVAAAGNAIDFQNRVQPLLRKYCFRCHSGTKPKGEVHLDTLTTDFIGGPPADLETWHDALENLNRGDMPPEDEPQPSPQEHGLLVDWLNQSFERARSQQQNTGGKVVLRRLTRHEYQYTLEDLLGMKLDFSKNLLPEVPSRDGFLNNGSVMSTSSQHMQYFWNAAQDAMSKAIVADPQPQVLHFYADRFGDDAPSNQNRKKKTSSPPVKRMTEKELAELEPYRNLLLPDTAVGLQLEDVPRSGKFRIRVNLQASGPPSHLMLWVTFLSGQTKVLLGNIAVPQRDGTQNVDFIGQMEDFPVLVSQFEIAEKQGVSNKSRTFATLYVSNMVQQQRVYNGIGERAPGSIRSAEKTRSQAEKLSSQSGVWESTPRVKVNSLEFTGPVFDQWPPEHHRNILFASKNSDHEPVYVREVLARFMERAFRRPVRDDEVEKFATLFEEMREQSATFEEAIRETLALVLVSPRFLYLLEPREASTESEPLTNYEWATRVSYFLHNSMPDRELYELAKAGTLSDPAVQAAQVQRMLRDEKSWRFIDSFTDQWLDLTLMEKVAVNPEHHPRFNDELKNDMKRETQLLFAEVLRKDLSCFTLVDADFTFLTARLADHYRIPHGARVGVALGGGHTRFPLKPEDQRGGLLTQASIMLLGSDGAQSHPIKRGVWVRRTLFDDPPADPPADVPDLEETKNGDLGELSLRQQIEQHRAKQSCNHCHRRIDPWGIPFEEFDAVGQLRTSYRSLKDRKAQKVPVEVDSELPDGQTVSGVAELKQYILTQGRQRFARAIVRKLLAYGLGRSLEFADERLVEQLTKGFADDGYRLEPLIVAIVRSDAFCNK